MKRFIKISTAVHITVLLFIIIVPSVFFPKYKHHMRPVHTVELITPEEFVPPKPVKKHEQKPVPTQHRESKPKKKSEPKKKRPVLKSPVPPLKTPSLSEKLRAELEKLKNLEQPSVSALPKSASVKETASYTPQFKATISSVPDFPFQWYLNFIQGKISSYWRTPQMAIAKQYSSMISFTILENGNVTNIRIKRSSGMNNFDKTAVDAIEQAQPLPPLPSGYKHQQLIINVEFRLE